MKIKKYKIKVVEVEAIQFLDTKESFDEIRAWVGEDFYYDYQELPYYFIRYVLLHQKFNTGVRKGNWIVKKPDGSFRVYDDKIFKDTYE